MSEFLKYANKCLKVCTIIFKSGFYILEIICSKDSDPTPPPFNFSSSNKEFNCEEVKKGTKKLMTIVYLNLISCKEMYHLKRKMAQNLVEINSNDNTPYGIDGIEEIDSRFMLKQWDNDYISSVTLELYYHICH